MTSSFPYAATNYQEDNRGQFHFSPRSGWMNDPNDFFVSTELLHWTFASRFKAGWLFECPNMIRMPLDGGYRWVLHAGSGEYYIGDWDGTAFHSDWTTPQKINQTGTHAGAGYYAALNFSNLKGDRVVSMAWQGENYGSIWTGNASFPVDLKLRRTADGIRVVANPVPEIDTLRQNPRTWKNLSLDAKAARELLSGVRVNTYELDAVVDVRDVQRFGFRLHTGPDGWFDRDIAYDARSQQLNGVALKPSGGKVRVRLLVDRGQLDVFGNDGDVYQSYNVNFDGLPGGDGLELFTEGRLRLDSLTIHELASIWRPLGEATLHTNLDGPWYAARGQWADVADGKQGKSPGDAFYLSTATGSDFTLDGDVRLVDGVAAALTFRATKDASRHYTVNVDAAANVVKLWRPGRDIATAPLQVERGRTYHFTVQTAGSNIKVALDGQQVIDAVDTEHKSGQFGMNVYNGTALVQNVSVR